MLSYDTFLDLAFQVLADGNRRAMLAQLMRGSASVSELTQPFDISLPAVIQHLTALESSGLVRLGKMSRVRACRVGPEALNLTEQWINQQRLKQKQHFDRLGAYLETLKTQGDTHGNDH